jgi:hypothetical protein
VTGFGCLNEMEFVVIGGQTDAFVLPIGYMGAG